MSSSDCATVIKRGYLYDKNAGILDAKKKWFVLRQDSVMGYCILEYFKDEKSWSKREPPKGFINVRDIVEVQRVLDKKQTFELLCPGIGYRLMAHSEADADDWADALRNLIVYRKDVRSMSFPRLMSGGGASPLSSSPPSLPFTTNTITGPLSHHALTVAPPPTFTIEGSHVFPAQPSPLTPQHHMQRAPHQFPTPPETIVDTVNPLTTPMLQKQVSSDGVNPFPSPPSSNDSASMCGSNTSFDSGSFNDGNEADSLQRAPSKYRVSIRDSDKLNAVGECDLSVNEDSMTLSNPITGSQIASWPLGAIRRYGVNSVCFTFESGRFCSTGEGQFFLYSGQSRVIYNRIHLAVLRMNKDPNTSRRGSAPIDTSALRTGSSMIIPISRVPSVTESLSSPPQYNHIEHHLKQSHSLETYTRLQQSSPSAISACSTFSTFTTPTEYERLAHGSQLFHSNTLPIMTSQQLPPIPTPPNPEPLYSTLNDVENGNKRDTESGDETVTAISDFEAPPPIPPRLSKTTPI